MNDKLLNPLSYYQTTGKDRHLRLAEALFERYRSKARIDPEENRKMIEHYCDAAQQLRKLKTGRWMLVLKDAMICLLIGIGIGMAVMLLGAAGWEIASWIAGDLGRRDMESVTLLALLLATVGIAWYLIVQKKKYHQAKEQIQEKNAETETKLESLRVQMKRLDQCFGSRDALNLFTQTLPEFQFLPWFTVEHRETLAGCDFVEQADDWTSVTDTLAGAFRENPFLFTSMLRRVELYRDYKKEKTVEWEVPVKKKRTVRDKDGKTRTEVYVEMETRSQTKSASIRAFYPDFTRSSQLTYGHQAAPNLHFSREPKHTQKKTEAAVHAQVGWKAKFLRMKSRHAVKKGESYLMMNNEEFEVLFGAADRDQEQPFRLLFTPLAQQNMVALLRDDTLGGDEFSMRKSGRCNMVSCDDRVLHRSPLHYHDYSLQEAKQAFLNHHQKQFRLMFGAFAPLLAIPAYQEAMQPMPCRKTVGQGNFPIYEHEAVANAFPQKLLASFLCETPDIRKTRLLRTTPDADIIEVTSRGYTTYDRVYTKSVRFDDGKYHNIDVKWVEYVPCNRTTVICMEKMSDKNAPEHGKPGTVCLHGLFAKIIETDKEEG